MNSHPDFDSSQESIEEAAVQWLLEREEGFEPQRAREFAAWCAADPRHVAEVAKAEEAFALVAELPKVKKLLRPSPRDTAKRGVFNWALLWRPAVWTPACAVFLAIAASWWYLAAAGEKEGLHLITGTANPQLVALNDGSLVDVNSNSSLKVLLLPAERRVEMGEGEAHFEVAHDSSRPFIVSAGGLSVRAVGTAFTVRVTKEQVEVLVVEGKVAVSQGSATPLIGKQVDLPPLVAEERLRSNRAERNAIVVEHADAKEIKDALAWHINITHFSNRPLSDVVALFNRRNAVKIEVADNDLAIRRIGGAFAIDRPLAFVRILERDGDIHAEQRSDNTIVLHRVH